MTRIVWEPKRQHRSVCVSFPWASVDTLSVPGEKTKTWAFYPSAYTWCSKTIRVPWDDSVLSTNGEICNLIKAIPVRWPILPTVKTASCDFEQDSSAIPHLPFLTLFTELYKWGPWCSHGNSATPHVVSLCCYDTTYTDTILVGQRYYEQRGKYWN